MPAGAAVHVVTGTPFPSTTFNAGTSTFSIPGNYTSMFNPNAIVTVQGTNTTNNGYYQVVSSTFTGGNTVVTVVSYSIGTAYPGTVPFVSSSAGTVLWIKQGVIVITGPGVGGGANGHGGIPGGTFHNGTWNTNTGVTFANGQVSSVVTGSGTSIALINGVSNFTSGTTPWTPSASAGNYTPVAKINGYYYTLPTGGPLGDGHVYSSTDLVTWTDRSIPTGYQAHQSVYYFLNDGTTAMLIYNHNNGSNVYDFRVSTFNGTTWGSPSTIVGGANFPFFVACLTGTGGIAFISDTFFQRLYISGDSGATWHFHSDVLLTHNYATSGGIAFDYADSAYYMYDGTSVVYTAAGIADGNAFYFDDSTRTTAWTTSLNTPGSLIYQTSDGIPYLPGTMNNNSSAYLNGFLGQETVPAYETKGPNLGQVISNVLENPFGIDISNPLDWNYNTNSPIMIANGKYYAMVSGIFADIPSSSGFPRAGWITSVYNGRSSVGGDLYASASDGISTVVAVGDLGAIIVSIDTGASWTSAFSGADGIFNGITYGNNRFVAVGATYLNTTPPLMYSTDGSTWTQGTTSSTDNLSTVAWGITPAKFVAVGFSGDWLYSSDGNTWSAGTFITASRWNQVRWQNDRFISCGSATSGPVAYSTDGITVTSATGPTSTDVMKDCAFGNSTYVVVGTTSGNNVSAYHSSNGSSWTAATISGAGTLKSVVYANSKFVALGVDTGFPASAVSYTSTDGITWSGPHTAASNQSPSFSLEWDGSNYVVGLTPNTFVENINIAKSADGITWSLATTGQEGTVWSITAVNGATIATGAVGTVLVE